MDNVTAARQSVLNAVELYADARLKGAEAIAASANRLLESCIDVLVDCAANQAKRDAVLDRITHGR